MSLPEAPVLNRVLTLTETTSYVSLCRKAVWAHRRAGDFPEAVHLTPRKIGFRLLELDAWLKARQGKRVGCSAS